MQGDTIAGTYSLTDVDTTGPFSDTLIENSGFTESLGSSTLSYTMSETANVLSGEFSETLTGYDRYSLLTPYGGGFKNVADVSGAATPGHLNFSPFGEAYVDDEPPPQTNPSGTEAEQLPMPKEGASEADDEEDVDEDYLNVSLTVTATETEDKGLVEIKPLTLHGFIIEQQKIMGGADSKKYNEWFKEFGAAYNLDLENKGIDKPYVVAGNNTNVLMFAKFTLPTAPQQPGNLVQAVTVETTTGNLTTTTKYLEAFVVDKNEVKGADTHQVPLTRSDPKTTSMTLTFTVGYGTLKNLPNTQLKNGLIKGGEGKAPDQMPKLQPVDGVFAVFPGLDAVNTVDFQGEKVATYTVTVTFAADGTPTVTDNSIGITGTVTGGKPAFETGKQTNITLKTPPKE
jgi:hypothetical protein